MVSSRNQCYQNKKIVKPLFQESDLKLLPEDFAYLLHLISYMIILEVIKIICLVHTNRNKIACCPLNLTLCCGCVVLDHANHVFSYLGPPLHCWNTAYTP